MSKYSTSEVIKKLRIENENLIKSNKRLQKTNNDYQDVINIQKELMKEYLPKTPKEKCAEKK
jgi:hypothetical protein